MPEKVYHIGDAGDWDAGTDQTRGSRLGILLCRSGGAELLLDDRFFRIGTNHLLFLPPYSRFQVLRRSADFAGPVLEADIDVFQALFAKITVDDRLCIRQHPCVLLDAEQRRRLEQALGSTLKLITAHEGDRGPGAAKLATHITHALLSTYWLEALKAYFDCGPATDAPKSTADQVLENFLQLLGHHSARERSVGFYAQRLHLSAGYLSALVKAKTGRSAMQWIIDFALLQAKHYLRSTTWSVKEIATAMNFPDQSTFGRYFRQHGGLSPTDYRKLPNHADHSAENWP